MKILASFMNVVLSVSSWFVALTGTLLNVSINLTMHIRDFVNSTPAIYDVWKAIRDISGMFIIFGLMYASIRMILGKDAKLGQTIKNIVVAGVLINFSFFITGLCIDASNIVSLQLYNAITPGQPDIGKLINSRDAASVGTLPQIVNTLFSDGGLSAVFMQSLQLQTTFNSKNLGMSDPSAGISTPFRIILIGTTGVVIMITAGLSFLFASLAFVIRLVLLLILLAFSPIWFAAAIIPQLKEYADEWWKVFKNQLIFMPAYLLFMYVALRIISNSNLFNTGAYGSLWKGAQTNALVPTEFISFAINAALIIVMLNIPLLAAIKLGAVTGGLLDGKKLGADAIWNKVRGVAYQGTISRGASAISRNEGLKNLASRSALGEMAFKGIKSTAKSYDEKLSKQVKSRTEFAEELGYDKRQEQFHTTELRDLEKQQSHLRSVGDVAGAKALDSRIGEIKKRIESVKTQRKSAYAERIEAKQVDTLWSKVARKDKVAAAKLQNDIHKKRMDDAQKALDKVREKIKSSEAQIEKLEDQIETGEAKDEAKTQAKIDKIKDDLKKKVYPDEKKKIEELENIEQILAPYENVS
jgi:hypothetical protein